MYPTHLSLMIVIEAQTGKFMTGWKVYCTPSTKPTPDMFANMVQAAGGDTIKDAPKKFNDKILIVSTKDDEKEYTALAKLGNHKIHHDYVSMLD
jgi:hypothetical protein